MVKIVLYQIFLTHTLATEPGGSTPLTLLPRNQALF